MRHYIIFLIIFLPHLLFAQHRCSTDEYLQNQINNNPNILIDIQNATQAWVEFKQAKSILDDDFIIYIPVVFHVIHNGENIGVGNNISDEQITSQLQILNENFNLIKGSTGQGVITNIRFCLANRDPWGTSTDGIVRYLSSNISFTFFDDDALVKNFGSWSSSTYLNIWVCNYVRDNGDETARGNLPFIGEGTGQGGASEPNGIIINSRLVGNTGTGTTITDYDLGLTLVHEVGHWLGLYHPWKKQSHNQVEDPDCTNNICEEDGDQVCDTPPVKGAAQDVGNNPNSNTCNERYTKCGTNPNTIISAENYMEWNYDRCMSFFTQDQKERMRWMLSHYRSNIYTFSQQNPGYLPTACTNPIFANPSSSNTSTSGEGWIRCEHPSVTPDVSFSVNHKSAPTVNVCSNEKVWVTFTDNDDGNCLKPPECWYTVPCIEDHLTGCNWFLQSIGYCDCSQIEGSFWISVYFNCDDNFNCTPEEIGKWWVETATDQDEDAQSVTFPESIDVASFLNFTFVKGKKYKVKLAIDHNCDKDVDDWKEGTKNIYVLPDATDLQFNNMSIPNNTYNTTGNIQISNVTVNAGNVTMVAGNSIKILPNTHITSYFKASIEPFPSCNSTARIIGDSVPRNNQIKYRILKNDVKSNSTYTATPNIENLTVHLFQNNPNPADKETEIFYTIASKDYVSITISNVFGDESIKILENKFQESGDYSIVADVSKLKPGLYCYTLKYGIFLENKKMIVIH